MSLDDDFYRLQQQGLQNALGIQQARHLQGFAAGVAGHAAQPQPPPPPVPDEPKENKLLLLCN